jgi:hypothetical protein
MLDRVAGHWKESHGGERRPEEAERKAERIIGEELQRLTATDGAGVKTANSILPNREGRISFYA